MHTVGRVLEAMHYEIYTLLYYYIYYFPQAGGVPKPIHHENYGILAYALWASRLYHPPRPKSRLPVNVYDTCYTWGSMCATDSSINWRSDLRFLSRAKQWELSDESMRTSVTYRRERKIMPPKILWARTNRWLLAVNIWIFVGALVYKICHAQIVEACMKDDPNCDSKISQNIFSPEVVSWWPLSWLQLLLSFTSVGLYRLLYSHRSTPATTWKMEEERKAKRNAGFWQKGDDK